MRKALTPLVLLLLMVLLAGCSAVSPSGGQASNPSVNGTISTDSMNLGTDASVSVSAGSKLVDEQVTLPAFTNAASPQNVTYSVTDIPPDTYEVAVTLASTSDWKGVKYSCWFTVNGAQQAASESIGTDPRIRTFSLTGLSITGATIVNFDLHPVVISKLPGKN